MMNLRIFALLPLLGFASAVPSLEIISRDSKGLNAKGEANDSTRSCRYLSSDPQWPSPAKWAALNSSVSGRLMASKPLALPCHSPQFNGADCAALAQGWPYPQTHFNSSSSIIAPYFQNQSCIPFTPTDRPCTLGNLVSYAIDVTTAQDVVHGLAFCKSNNVRAVIKNTGHDFLGRSTGGSGLGLWTHNLKSIEYMQYHSQHYSGPAMKFGAGVQVWEAFDASFSYGVRVVGGTCPTVGLAGGYSQGGGHGMLSSIAGLSADNVLEWEVVTADGQQIVATPTEHPDLYWALSGGGAGNFAVVLSMTQRAFADGPMGGASITMLSSGLSSDLYWDAVEQWHAIIPSIVANGGTTGYLVNNELLEIQHITFANRTTAEMQSALAPFVGALRARNITFDMNVTSLPNFLEHTQRYIGLPYGDDPSNQVTGSRLIPQCVLENNTSAVTSAVRSICSDPRFTVLGVGVDVSKEAGIPNAVLPAWRQTNLHLIISGYWNYTEPWANNVNTQMSLTSTQIPKLEAISPGSGSYMNEGNFEQPDWQETFYGSKYSRLLGIKQRYDATGLLYVTKGVGSDAWTLDSDDGRLCRSITR